MPYAENYVSRPELLNKLQKANEWGELLLSTCRRLEKEITDARETNRVLSVRLAEAESRLRARRRGHAGKNLVRR